MEPTGKWSIALTHGDLIITCEGELDIYNSPKLRTDIEVAVEGSSVRSVKVDWTRVYFVDSAGLALLLGLRKLPNTGTAGLCLEVAVGSQPARVAQLSRFPALFAVDFVHPI